MDKAEFLLKGYSYEKKVNINYNNLVLSIESDKNKIDNLNELNRSLEIGSETAKLVIEGSFTEDISLALALDIKNLLSIALGKRITFDRQLYWKNGAFEEIRRTMSKNHNFGEQVVPDTELANFLSSTLNIWLKFTNKEKNDIFIITDYLNQTNLDFIEDRILRTVQAWECAAMYWQEEIELTDDYKDLKEKLKETFNIWKKEKSFIDNNGELGTKILASIEQEKLLLKLENLVSKANLNTKIISLDLRRMKNLRDKVAHTGRIGIPGNKAIEILQPGVFGLQLLLLKKLGYHGLVIGERNGWPTNQKLQYFFE
ncbi:MAG: hypothetical protein K9H61_03065 [Bacteroidia bacterium]|nr:hypothetical protein [Bacteroidia bacterium]MCF8426707.1 hypothetical protein [Bacteroidia bacterium]MCF8445953.1 hypothetical protein [Bacteroidia bacterium]